MSFGCSGWGGRVVVTTHGESKGSLGIVDVVAQYVPGLQKSGRNYKAVCPFHADKTPSFFVFPDRQSWRCFGVCATGGDVFTFVMRREQLNFSEALKVLCNLAFHARHARPVEHIQPYGLSLCACRRYWLEENLKIKWVPRFISRRPLVDEERHSRIDCSFFDQEDISLP